MIKGNTRYTKLKSRLKKIENRKLEKYIFYFTVSMVAAWFTWFKVFRGEFSLIDDHALLPFIGNNHIPLSEFFTLLIGSTEIGQWGESVRYRPVSILLQFVQIILFNDTAALYYSVRVVILVAASSIFLKTISMIFFGITRTIKFGVLLAVSLTFSILPAWGDILNRLGPTEIYQVLILVVLLNYGFNIVLNPKNFGNYVPFLVTATIFYGTKEDALIAMPFSMLVGFIGYKYFPAERVKLSIVTFTNLGFGFFISTGVIIALTKNNGSDIYGNSRGITNLFDFVFGAITSLSSVITLTMWILVGVLLNTAAVNSKDQTLGLRKLSIFTVSVLTVWIWEHIFYANNFGGSFNRYSIVSQVLFLFIILIYLSEFCRVIGILKPIKNATTGLLVGLTIPIITYFVIAPIHNQLRAINDLRINETINFEQNLSRIEVLSRTVNQIRLVSNQPGDFERIYSINRYLTSKKIFLPVYLEYNSEVRNTSNTLNSSLDSQLRFISKNGNSDWGIKPKLDAKKGPEICISFTQVASFPNSCSQVLNVLEEKVE